MLSALVAFVVLWMIFDVVSLASVDVHPDWSEAALWAHHFAFGYKHPPMTAWLFMLWFAVFPRQDWAADLLNVMVVAIGLGITWRLLRDHLDKNRALLGLLALVLIPLYDIKTAILNANTVMIPFWAAALLFYLRARRGLGILDAFLAGAFASLTVFGKYWALFLVAGMAVASVVGPGTRRFWRSSAPYVMALGAAIVIAPHAWWFVSERGGTSYAFMRDTVVVSQSFGTALPRSGHYLINCVAYAIVPIIFLVALRPSRAAFAEMIWPRDDDRRQALLLFLVPLVLPALVNLAIPYRLTADWTYPNWALLPVVLYASRDIIVDERAVARAGLVALAVTVAAIVVSPVVAYARLTRATTNIEPISAKLPARGSPGRPARASVLGLLENHCGAAVLFARGQSSDGRPIVGGRPRGHRHRRTCRGLPQHRRAVPKGRCGICGRRRDTRQTPCLRAASWASRASR